MNPRPGIVLCATILTVCPALAAAGADEWIEMKSAHFTVVSNAGERSTRTLVWRLEQVRSATATLWPWVKVDLNKPLSVLAVKDEPSMRRMAPQYWERRGGGRPASVWVMGADRHYLTIRADLNIDSQGTINPHITAYFSYINLMMRQSLGQDTPFWLARGLSGVLSNTLVKDDQVVIGAPIPWYLERLRERKRMSLSELVTITRNSPAFKQQDGQELFDAQAWAFVHFLLFGEGGARSSQLNAFAKLVGGDANPAAAFRETLGSAEALENPFRIYFGQRIFTVHSAKVDLGVERERFPIRRLTAAESASARALFHAAMGRPVEARAAIAEARQADPKSPGSYEAEGLLLDREDKPDEAKTAFSTAVESGSTNAHVHFRLASLTWRPDADQETLKVVERHLASAVAFNNRDAHAYSWLAEIRSALGMGEPIGLVIRAISLEPREAVHRLRAASVLARQKQLDDAIVQAQTGLRLADSDDERERARDMLDRLKSLRSKEK